MIRSVCILNRVATGPNPGGPVSPLEGFIPWSAENDKRSPHTTPLSKFRDNSPCVDTLYSAARAVSQACCEITSVVISNPLNALMACDKSCLVVSGIEGWKERDPVLQYWLLDEKSRQHPYEITPTLMTHPSHIALDVDRKLIFAGDWHRIKSYSCDKHGVPVHTLKSDLCSGPMLVLPGGRLLRAGGGRATCWNLDDLETHGAQRARIGEGEYDLWDNGTRNFDAEQELSTGSLPTSTLTFQDSNLEPEQWTFHQPSQKVLCAPKTRECLKPSHTCLSLDLEHGATTGAQFLGHGGIVKEFSFSEHDPDSFITACSDGFVRLYDLRHPLPSITVDASMKRGPCNAAAYAHVDGLPCTCASMLEPNAVSSHVVLYSHLYRRYDDRVNQALGYPCTEDGLRVVYWKQLRDRAILAVRG